MPASNLTVCFSILFYLSFFVYIHNIHKLLTKVKRLDKDFSYFLLTSRKMRKIVHFVWFCEKFSQKNAIFTLLFQLFAKILQIRPKIEPSAPLSGRNQRPSGRDIRRATRFLFKHFVFLFFPYIRFF